MNHKEYELQEALLGVTGEQLIDGIHWVLGRLPDPAKQTEAAFIVNGIIPLLGVEELRSAVRAIDGEMARRAGEPIIVRDRCRDEEPPPGGALLKVEWAVEDESYTEWYPSEEAALAGLSKLAGKQRIENGYVDLTAPGCHRSYARVIVQEDD